MPERVVKSYRVLVGMEIHVQLATQSKMFTGPNLATGEILYGNSYWRADALLGYAVQGLKGRKLTFQLNVFNVFNERDPLVIRYATNDPSTVFRHVVQPPTTWRLTMNLEF